MNFNRVIALAAIVFALHFGYGFAEPIVRSVWAAHTSQHWPQTQGSVVHVSIEKGHKGRPYELVEYAYVVGGKTYQSNGISFMSLDSDAVSPQDLATRYPIGKAVNVFYNPDAPQEAVLRPGLHSYLPVAMLVLGLLVVVGALGSFGRVFLRAGKGDKPKSE